MSINENNDAGAGAGASTLRQRRGRGPTQGLAPEQQQEPIISHDINSQLSSAVIEKAQLELNKLNPSNKLLKRRGIRNKFSGLISDTGQLSQDKRIEIEKGIFEILGVENSDKDAVKKAPNFIMIVIIVLLVLGGIVAVIILVVVVLLVDSIKEIHAFPFHFHFDPVGLT